MSSGPVSSGERLFAFVRAVNVTGRRLTNRQLMEPFRLLGFEDIAAYQAAGNIAFRAQGRSAVDRQRLDRVATDAYGFEAVTFVRTAAELQLLVDAEPFTDGELAGTEGRIQVGFLHRVPGARLVNEVKALVPSEDRLEFLGPNWLWLPSTDIAGSRLALPTIESILGPMTVRTLGTISRMLARFTP